MGSGVSPSCKEGQQSTTRLSRHRPSDGAEGAEEPTQLVASSLRCRLGALGCAPQPTRLSAVSPGQRDVLRRQPKRTRARELPYPPRQMWAPLMSTAFCGDGRTCEFTGMEEAGSPG